MEFWSHLKSPRLIVLAVLMALLVFGVSYGMTQSGSSGLNSTIFTVYPAVRNESGTDHYLAIGWIADERGVPKAGAAVTVYFQNYSVPPVNNGKGTVVATVQTNASGFALYEVGTKRPVNASYAMEYGDHEFRSVDFVPPMSNATFFMGYAGQSSYSSPSGGGSFFSFHAMTLDGFPATAAIVYLDGNYSGHPDSNGFYSASVPEGNHVINVSYQGYTVTYTLVASPSTGPVYLNGADAVLLNLVGGFMGLILPILAIAVSFDAIARERAQGSLELLLARRVRREGILAGKFLGAFTAIAVPLVAVLLGGIAAVTFLSGRAPTGTFAAAVFGASLFLVAVYVLLMLLFSSLAKSVGTAVVFGVVVWLFFNLIFSFITTFLMISSGGYLFSQGFYSSLLTAYLFDPNMVYQLMLGAAIPSTGGGTAFGLINPTGYLSVGTILLAAALWIVIPLILTIFVFRKRAEN